MMTTMTRTVTAILFLNGKPVSEVSLGTVEAASTDIEDLTTAAEQQYSAEISDYESRGYDVVLIIE